MSLLSDDIETFIENQAERIEQEVSYWDDFREDNPEGAYYPFTQHRREGQHFTKNNALHEDKEEALRSYVELPHVESINGVLVDHTSLQTPYNCMWKSCFLTGHYCCKVTTCTAHTPTSASVMREAGRHFIDLYSDEERKAKIRRGDTHTAKLNMNAQVDGHCVFGETRHDTSPSGEEHPHIHCILHDAAYDNDIPLHYLHSIGSSLFPADILILDGQYFVTAASKIAKEKKVTRWWITSDSTICTNHGDTSDAGILQHPDYDAMFTDILGRDTVEAIQRESYGSIGPVEPNIQDGWIHADSRGLTETQSECRNCDGQGCDTCDNRGYFLNWE